MSVKALSAVFEDSRSDGAAFAVLIAMADWADHNGRCYPSYSQIMRKARLKSRSTVIDALKALEALGELERESSGHAPTKDDDDVPSTVARQRRNTYRILLVRKRQEVDRTANHLDAAEVDRSPIQLCDPEVDRQPIHLDAQVDRSAIGDRSVGDLEVDRLADTHIRNSPSVQTVTQPSDGSAATENAPPRTRTLLEDYHDAFVARFTTDPADPKKPAIIAGKDGKLLKDLADRVGDANVRRMLLREGQPGWFFRTPDPFINSTGYTVGVFVSCFDKLQLTEKPAKDAASTEAQLAMMADMRARGEARQAELERQAREALIAATPEVRERVRADVVADLRAQFPGIDQRMPPDRWAHCVKGGMVRFVVDVARREQKAAADIVATYAQKVSAA